MAKPKEQNFLHGAVILTAGVIITKILGAIYKIPLGNILGDDGYAYFYSAYSVYNVFLTMTTAGLPVAMSRMVAEAHEQGHYMQVRRTFSVSWWTFLVIGFISACIMFLFPQQLANLLDRPEAAASIYTIAPGILFVCVVSAYRGYCQGHKNMTPTTIGQVIEVLVKVIVGLALAIFFVRQGRTVEIACSGATFGVTVGGFAVLIYMYLYKRRNYHDPEKEESADTPMSRSDTLNRLLSIGIPLTIGSSGMSLISLIDTKFINNRLQMAAGFSPHDSAVLFGVFSKAQTLYNLPAAFVTPLVISIVPSIAAYMVVKDYKNAGKTSEDALRITLDICMPMGIGLAVLAAPIMDTLYHGSHSSGPRLLAIMGLASFFVCFSLVQNAILQAHGNEKLTIVSLFTGGIIKITVDWFLVAVPSINIYGAPIGTILCYAVICIMNHIFIRKHYEYKPSLARIVPKPLISSLIMGVFTMASYYLIRLVIHGESRLETLVCMLFCVAVAVVVYVVAVVHTRAITKEDMSLIPKGDKIARYLHLKSAE